MDHPELNHVLLDRDDGENKDFTDAELERALKQALAKINAYPPRTSYTFSSFPSKWYYTLLIDQAIVRLLMMKGILRTRNEMPYQDNGGISVECVAAIPFHRTDVLPNEPARTGDFQASREHLASLGWSTFSVRKTVVVIA